MRLAVRMLKWQRSMIFANECGIRFCAVAAERRSASICCFHQLSSVPQDDDTYGHSRGFLDNLGIRSMDLHDFRG